MSEVSEFNLEDLFGGSTTFVPEPDPEPEPGLDEFLAGLPEGEIPTAFIRIQSSLAGVRDVPVDPDHTVNGLPGYTLREVLTMGGITYGPEAQFWAGETQVDLDYAVPIGQTVTGIGVVKGG